jgi:hypothetical protein
MYGLKTNVNCLLSAGKRWFADITDLRGKYETVVVVQDKKR